MSSEFLQWCASKRINTSKISIQTCEKTQDRTVFAACDLLPGDVVLAVPFAALISTPGLRCGLSQCPLDVDGVVDVSKAHFTSSERLASTLAEAREVAEDSVALDARGYVADCLRDDVHDGPVFTWSDDDVRELQFPRAIANVMKIKARDARVVDRVFDVARGASWTKRFRWALAVVRSRAVDLERDESFLAPGLDMFNHSHANANVKWEASDGGEREWIHLKATTRCAAGEELLVTYACAPSETFLLHMGFVGGFNPSDRCELWGTLAEAANWFTETFKSEEGEEVLDKIAAQEIAEELERQQRARERVAMVGLSSGAHDDASAELKLREMQNLVFGPSVGWKMDYDEALWEMFRHFTRALMPTERADVIVRHAINKRCEEVLLSMPTTIEEDEMIFSNEQTPPRLKLAAEFRMYKKALLIRHLQSAAESADE